MLGKLPRIAPLKHPQHPQSPSAMTVCIAAVCQQNGEPRILLCSDTRMSQGQWGSTDLTCKLDVIGRGWVVQWAHQQDSAYELITRLKEWFRVTHSLDTIHAVSMAVKSALGEFRNSPVCRPSCCELLISGFVALEPIIVKISPDETSRDGRLLFRIDRSFAAIGSGAHIATNILNCRDYIASKNLDSALFRVYEAKRFSEKADGVGPFTALAIQAPSSESLADRAVLAIVSRHEIAMLDGIFRATSRADSNSSRSSPPSRGSINSNEPHR